MSTFLRSGLVLALIAGGAFAADDVATAVTGSVKAVDKTTKTVVVTQPASGTVAISGNQVLYTPVQLPPVPVGSGATTVWTYDTTTTGTQTATIAICNTVTSTSPCPIAAFVA